MHTVILRLRHKFERYADDVALIAFVAMAAFLVKFVH
jgi:hypothetical protein